LAGTTTKQQQKIKLPSTVIKHQCSHLIFFKIMVMHKFEADNLQDLWGAEGGIPGLPS